MGWKDEDKLIAEILEGLGLAQVTDLPHQHVDFPTNLDDTNNADLGNLLMQLGALRGRQTWLLAQVQTKTKCIEAEYAQQLWAAVGLLELAAPKKRLKDAMIADARQQDVELMRLYKDLTRHKILLATLAKTFDIYDGLYATTSRAISVRELMHRSGGI